MKPIVHKSWVHLLATNDLKNSVEAMRDSLDKLEEKKYQSITSIVTGLVNY